MINKDRIIAEIDKMRNWPMTPDNVSTLAAMLYIKEHLKDDEHHEHHRDENREGVSVDPYAKHHKPGGKSEADIEYMFRKFMEQYSK